MKRQRRNKIRPCAPKRFKRKIVVGLTGSFGSGKTAVAKIFKTWGAEIVDADRIAHQILRPGTKIYKKIIKAFGKSILKKDKTINRNKLGRIVFSNRNRLIRLNEIMHPEIIRRMKKKIRATRAKVIVLDAPLLIEAGLKNIVDKLIVVKIDKKCLIKRLIKKTHLAKADILKRIKAQIPLVKKVRLADFVIDNRGAIAATKKQVKKIWEQIHAPR